MRIKNHHGSLVAGILFGILAVARETPAGGPLPPPLPSLQLFTTLAWQASPSPEVTGYAVYYQIAGVPGTNRMDAGKALSVTIPFQVGLVHSIHAVAYSADGVESEPSNIIHYTPPPLTPVKLARQTDGTMQIRFRTSPLSLCWVEWTASLEQPSWQLLTLGWLVADSIGNVVVNDFGAAQQTARFYRAVRY